MYFCSHCGSEISGGAFCEYCGARVETNPYDAGTQLQRNPNPYDAGAPFPQNAEYAQDDNATVGPTFWGATSYCFKNYVRFSGRATRTEYWGWVVANFLIGIAIGIITSLAPEAAFVSQVWNWATILPTWALISRRLHDTNLPCSHFFAAGGLTIFALILIGLGGASDLDTFMIAGLCLLVGGLGYGLCVWIRLAFIRGTQGPNLFGPSHYNP